MGTIKVGDYEVIVKKGDTELDAIPDDLPVHDFDGNTVTLGESRDGYMRQADYTQKTQKVSEVSKFLVDELGFQDQSQGVATMRKVLDTMNELGSRGVIDLTTGEIKETQSKTITPIPGGEEEGSEGFTLGMENLPPEMRTLMTAHETLQKDMGSLMGYISRKEIRENFESVTEEEVEMVHKLAAVDPSKSPMDHMVDYAGKKKEWGQTAVDAYVEGLKEPVTEGHVRDVHTGDEVAVEIFGQEPVFSAMPGEHGEGANVIDPSVAADKYLAEAMKGIPEGD